MCFHPQFALLLGIRETLCQIMLNAVVASPINNLCLKLQHRKLNHLIQKVDSSLPKSIWKLLDDHQDSWKNGLWTDESKV
jgi:hypothetical protein